MALPRDLSILTRDQGVRKENPILTDTNSKYFLPSSVRTPGLRKQADDLFNNKTGFGLKIKTTKRISK